MLGTTPYVPLTQPLLIARPLICCCLGVQTVRMRGADVSVVGIPRGAARRPGPFHTLSPRSGTRSIIPENRDRGEIDARLNVFTRITDLRS